MHYAEPEAIGNAGATDYGLGLLIFLHPYHRLGDHRGLEAGNRITS
jgi:hypothetical protein